MAITIHNPNNWRGIRSQTCFGCAHRVWEKNSETGKTYCSLEIGIPMGTGNLRPSKWTCNLWKKWKGNNEK